MPFEIVDADKARPFRDSSYVGALPTTTLIRGELEGLIRYEAVHAVAVCVLGLSLSLLRDCWDFFDLNGSHFLSSIPGGLRCGFSYL